MDAWRRQNNAKASYICWKMWFLCLVIVGHGVKEMTSQNRTHTAICNETKICKRVILRPTSNFDIKSSNININNQSPFTNEENIYGKSITNTPSNLNHLVKEEGVYPCNKDICTTYCCVYIVFSCDICRHMLYEGNVK